MSQICPEHCVESGAVQVRFQSSDGSCLPGRTAPADRSGTRSTGCLTAAQVQKKLGPAWTERGRPPAGYFTKRTAEEWLRARARRGAPWNAAGAGRGPGRRSRMPRRSGCATSSTTARRKPSTMRGYRSIDRVRSLLPAFGTMPLEDVTPAAIERLARAASTTRAATTRNKLLILLHGIFQRARKALRAADEPGRRRREARASRSGDLEVFSARGGLGARARGRV